MAYKGEPEVHSHHPAHKAYLATMVLLGLTIILGFIAVFVPWVQKDIAVGQRANAYPFKTCIEETFSTVNKETCLDNDFMSEGGAPLTGGNSTCRALILTTIAFVFISVIGAVLTFLSLIYVMDQIWSRLTCVASVAQIALVIICISCFAAWIVFICYAENTCAPNSIFPVQGYSYGFILYIFATATSLGAVVTGFMGIRAMKGFVPVKGEDEVEEPESPQLVQYPLMHDIDEAHPVMPTPHGTPDVHGSSQVNYV